MNHTHSVLSEATAEASSSWSMRPRQAAWIFGSIVAFITVAGVWSAYARWGPRPCSSNVVTLFDLDYESGVGSWYSSFAILTCSALLGLTAVARKAAQDRHFREWRLLAVIFLFLSVDEVAGFHELTIPPLRAYLHTGGVFYFAWVIPGGLFALLVLLRMLPFLRDLDASTRLRFLLAGGIFVAGALGMEMVDGAYRAEHGPDGYYASLVVIEEFLEMIGIVVFLHALLRYMATHVPKITLTFKP